MKPTVIKFNQTQYLNVSASENIKESLIAICETLDETETVYSTIKPPIKLKKKWNWSRLIWRLRSSLCHSPSCWQVIFRYAVYNCISDFELHWTEFDSQPIDTKWVIVSLLFFSELSCHPFHITFIAWSIILVTRKESFCLFNSRRNRRIIYRKYFSVNFSQSHK